MTSLALPSGWMRDQRLLGALALAAAVALGASAGIFGSVGPLAVAVVYAAAGLAAVVMGKALQFAVAVNVVLAVGLPDVTTNAGLTSVILLVLAAQAGAVLVLSHASTLTRMDFGAVLLVAAAIWPLLIGSGFSSVMGAAGFVAVMYATGRAGALSPRALVVLLAAIGAVHGVVAIADEVPALSGLVPFEPIREGVVFDTTRSTGLFNNPNTMGNLEAVILVAVARFGIARWAIPLVVLCVAGLILSESREALLGLVAGLGVLGAGRSSRMLRWAVAVAAIGIGTIVAFPSVAERLNPTGYSTDVNLLTRLEIWRIALTFIERSPLLGYGIPSRNPAVPDFVDQAYLGWLLAGGVTGLALWLTGAALITSRSLWPVLASMMAIGMLANPFSEAAFGAFLVLCGVVAGDAARRRRPAEHPVESAIGTSPAWSA